MATLVISYARPDQPLVRGVVKLLRAALHEIDDAVFWDEDFAPGEAWFKQITQSIDAAPKLFVFWCGHSAGSVAVARELAYAFSAGKTVVPVLLDDTPLSDALAAIHGVDLRGAVRHRTPRTSRPPAVPKPEFDDPIPTPPRPYRPMRDASPSSPEASPASPDRARLGRWIITSIIGLVLLAALAVFSSWTVLMETLVVIVTLVILGSLLWYFLNKSTHGASGRGYGTAAPPLDRADDVEDDVWFPTDSAVRYAIVHEFRRHLRV